MLVKQDLMHYQLHPVTSSTDGCHYRGDPFERNTCIYHETFPRTELHLCSLLDQFGHKFIIGGDFNAKQMLQAANRMLWEATELPAEALRYIKR